MVFYNRDLVFYFLCFVLFTHTACEKSIISPPNQAVAFIKYYGHVSDQTAHDLQKTPDGGYIILGSTNSFNEEVEHDVFVVKADQYGNEEWSTNLGRASTSNGSSSSYINFHEVGISLVILPEEAGYVIACNRTYVNYTTVNPAPPDYTKIVLYQLDFAGVNTTLDPEGKELEDDTKLSSLHPRAGKNSSESVSDLIVVDEGGNRYYVLTGNTDNVTFKSPQSYSDDLTDIYTVKLNDAFDQLTSFTKIYGKPGSDFASSLHILDDAYLVIGTSEKDWNDDPSSPNYKFQVIAVKYDKISGVSVNPIRLGGESNSLDLACSVMDTNTNHTFIATSSIEADVNGNIQNNKVIMYELDHELNEIRTMEHQFGMNLSPQAIDITHDGFILSFNHKRTDKEHDIAVSKFDKNFSLLSGWPVFFGYNNAASTFSTLEEAGSIIAENDPNTGATVSYTFVGTYGLGTNDMIGLTKLNADGNFDPPE
jgi:hypothetical protein